MSSTQESARTREARSSLERIQKFEVETLARDAELGQRLNFREVIAPAQRLIDLYQRLAPSALDDFPDEILQNIQTVADQDFNRFKQILEFSPEQGSPYEVKQSLIQGVAKSYSPTFRQIYPLIAYSLYSSADFQRLEREGRAAVQGLQDKSDAISSALKRQLEDATRIVDDVRKVAAETGVTQQAIYFKDEAASHDLDAGKWRRLTFVMAWALGIYAIASLFIAKLPFLAPTDVYQSIHLGMSKVLIFAVLSFVLYLAARNFLAHTHNAIVNRHRQNALLTYKALADAAKSPEKREVVLAHASACIFSPQSTGYAQDAGSDATRATSVVEVLSKPVMGGDK